MLRQFKLLGLLPAMSFVDETRSNVAVDVKNVVEIETIFRIPSLPVVTQILSFSTHYHCDTGFGQAFLIRISTPHKIDRFVQGM